MTIIEQKLDALMRYAASDNDFDREKIRIEIRNLLCESDPVVIYSEREREVRRVLLSLSTPEYMAGYHYLLDSILLAMENEIYLDNVTWGIYAPVAVKYSSSISKVNRGLTNIIEAIWNKAPYTQIDAYFNGICSSENGRPTNSQFIARVANIVKYDLLKGADSRCR